MSKKMIVRKQNFGLTRSFGGLKNYDSLAQEYAGCWRVISILEGGGSLDKDNPLLDTCYSCFRPAQLDVWEHAVIESCGQRPVSENVEEIEGLIFPTHDKNRGVWFYTTPARQKFAWGKTQEPFIIEDARKLRHIGGCTQEKWMFWPSVNTEGGPDNKYYRAYFHEFDCVGEVIGFYPGWDFTPEDCAFEWAFENDRLLFSQRDEIADVTDDELEDLYYEYEDKGKLWYTKNNLRLVEIKM